MGQSTTGDRLLIDVDVAVHLLSVSESSVDSLSSKDAMPPYLTVSGAAGSLAAHEN